MLITLHLFFFGLFSLAFLAYLGYGPARLLMPQEWEEEHGLLAPLVGYLLLLLVGYYAVRTVLNLVGALVVLAVLGTAFNVLALWQWWRGRRPALAGLWPQARRGFIRHMRAHGPAWLIAFLAFLVAILPLLRYGYITIIGENWDPENYLIVGEYLKRGPAGEIAAMPENPLRDLNASPPRIGLTLGFSVLQGTLGLITGQDGLRTFAPTLAFLCGLAAMALYLLFRRGFGMGLWAGTLATLLGALAPLSLWAAFFNFGMQMSALPLVPLGLALWLLLLRRPSWRTLALAALAVAAIPISYYPALTIYVPLALGVGLYEVLRAGRRRWGVLAAGLLAAVLASGLAFGPILDYGAGFSFRYSQQLTTLGLFHFISAGQVLGLAPFFRPPEPLPPAWAYAQWAGLVALALLTLAALILDRRRWLWPAVLLPIGLYLGWLRGWLWTLANALGLRGEVLARLEPYPYAFLKGAVFATPLLLALAIAGAERLAEMAASWRGKRIAWTIPAGLLLLPTALLLASDSRLLTRYGASPAHFDREALQVEEAVHLLPPGASVYLTGRPERSRLELSLYAYFLREHPVQGRLNTAYAAFDHRLPGQEPTYALLDAEDNPLPPGFFPENALWRGGGMVLYRRDPTILSFLDLRAEAYAGWPWRELHALPPLEERLASGYGACTLLAPETPLVLYADAGRISRQEDLPGSAGRGSLLLSFATFEPATATLRWADGVEATCALPAGLSTCRSADHALPARIEIAAPEGKKVWACWAALAAPDSAPAAEQRHDQALFWPEVGAEGQELEVALHVHNPTGRPLRLALEVWENTFAGARHYAWWGPLALPEDGLVTLRADLDRREATAAFQGAGGAVPADFPPHPGAANWPEVTDGSYFAALWVYYGAQVVEVLPVGQFEIVAGQVQNLQPINLGARPVWPHSPESNSGARFGPAVELSAYALGTGPFSPGERVPLALEWHALEKVPLDYSVTAQLLRDGRLWGQWDGPLGQWYPATAWQMGQHIRDDIPLFIASDAPPGRYRLIVAVYDPATGARLEVHSASEESLGDFLDLAEIEVR